MTLAIASLLQKEGFGTQAFYNQTSLHPLGLTAVLLLGAALIACKRRHAIWPMLVMACLIPPGQRLVILGADFSLMRVMIIFAWVRLTVRGEWQGLKWKRIDTVITAFLLTSTVIYVALHGSGAIVHRVGKLYDAVGLYFFFRCAIRDWHDLHRIWKILLPLAIVSLVFFLMEKSTRQNLFSVLGGVPKITVIREGPLRCQGPFVHPIHAGVFWAALIPLLAVHWWDGNFRGKVVGAVGTVACVGIIICSSSSTPLGGAAAVMLGGFLWRYRNSMRPLRWAVVAMLFGLHLVMEAPVWKLIARIDVVGGSTGYHRFRLIDAFINNFEEWWLIGTPATAHWGHQMFDVTNQYIQEGVRGGLLSLLLFIMVITVAFGGLGRAWRAAGRNRTLARLNWAIGVMLFAQCLMFFAISITHSSQSVMLWYLGLGAAGCLTPVLRRAGARGRKSIRGPQQAPALRGYSPSQSASV